VVAARSAALRSTQNSLPSVGEDRPPGAVGLRWSATRVARCEHRSTFLVTWPVGLEVEVQPVLHHLGVVGLDEQQRGANWQHDLDHGVAREVVFPSGWPRTWVTR